jgi:hypothetical protein
LCNPHFIPTLPIPLSTSSYPLCSSSITSPPAIQATANLAYAIALDLGDAWEEFLENADFRPVIYERGPNGSFPKKHIVRTAPESAWVDHWSGWVAFAVAMLVLVIIETLAMRFVLPR